MTQRTLRELYFEHVHDERDQVECTLRGYRSHVWAILDDGSWHPLYFTDVARLRQTLEDEVRAGTASCFAEPGLVVLPEVTTEAMENAARELARGGYFDRRQRPEGK